MIARLDGAEDKEGFVFCEVKDDKVCFVGNTRSGNHCPRETRWTLSESTTDGGTLDIPGSMDNPYSAISEPSQVMRPHIGRSWRQTISNGTKRG